MRRFVESYKLDTIAQSFAPKNAFDLKKADEHVEPLFAEFLDLVEEFVARESFFSTRRGTLEWLDLIYRTLDLLSRLIETIGEKNYAKYDEETRWFVEFAVNGMIEIVQRVQRQTRKMGGLFRKAGRKDGSILRQQVSFILSQLGYSLFTIVLAIVAVEEGKLKLQELYDVVGESVYRTRKIH